MRKIVLDILRDPKLSIASVNPLITFEESPAAPRKHHMFPRGLIIHTVAVTKVAEALCRIFEDVYGVRVDRDLVIAAAILHDIYKYYQYARDDVGGGYRARDDWYLSHDYAIVAELSYRGAKDDIIRVVSETHGIAPIATFEGLIVHLADSIDARFGEYLQNTILSKLKPLENEKCNTAKAFIEALRNSNIKTLVEISSSIRDASKLIEFVKKYCSST